MNLRRVALLASALAMLCAALPASAAEDYPSRPIRLVVGYAAGGTTDMVARLIAKELTDRFGQPIVVDNRPGANSNLGTEFVTRAAPDGYTLLLATVSNTTNATMYPNATFDIQRDLVPVASIGIVPNVLEVPMTSPITTFEAYVDYVRKNPGKMTFASPGIGSSVHLSGELFKSMAKVDMLHVPYKGSSPAIADLLANQVGSMFDNLPSSLPQIKAGKFRPLAVTSPARIASLPDIPTVAEKGFPGFEAYSWTGIMVPKGTPPAIVTKVSNAISQIVENPQVAAQMEQIGATPMYKGPDQFGKFVNAEIAKWATVIQQSGAKIE